MVIIVLRAMRTVSLPGIERKRKGKEKKTDTKRKQ
jgi:hypothetical protein